MTPVKKSMLIEVPLNSVTATQFAFPEVSFLRGKKVTGISASSANVSVDTALTNWFYVIQNQVASTYVGTATFMTFQDKSGKQFIQNLPVVELLNLSYLAINSGVNNTLFINNFNGLFEIVPREIIFAKSFMFIPAAVGVANYCALFNVFYQD